MPRRTIFLTGLQSLQISGDLGRGEKIGSLLKITNNKTRIAELIPSFYKDEIGSIEFKSLRSTHALIFSEFESTHDESSNAILQKMLRQVREFLMATWLLESNAINCESGFLVRQTTQGTEFSSNFFFQKFTDTHGSQLTTTWDRERLRAARQIHNNRFKSESETSADEPTKLVHGTERFSRTLYHISIARSDEDIALKIASYCAAFETLMSTSQSELSHQLSERIACLLTTEPNERVSVYRQVKEAYGVRSKVVHGATIKRSGMASLTNISDNCDSIARSLLVRILSDENLSKIFEGPDDQLDNFMLRTIFSSMSPAQGVGWASQ